MLIMASNLQEYFRTALSVAMEKTSIDLTEHAQAYLVYLLNDFSRSEKVYAGVDHGDKPTLALLMSRAQEAEPEEALRIFKHLGDSSLYHLGFFKEAAQTQVVGANYYITMGESGYGSAANLSRDQALTAVIYEELAERFCDLVALFQSISMQGDLADPEVERTPAQLMNLMKRYERTKNPDLLELLALNGVWVGSAMKGKKTVQ